MRRGTARWVGDDDSRLRGQFRLGVLLLAGSNGQTKYRKRKRRRPTAEKNM